jgi:hypothetical protein
VLPEHVSAASQAPAAAWQTVPAGFAEQVPMLPARLQAPQPPLQALLQHTPSTQKPVAHWPFEVQELANETSKSAVAPVVVVPLLPPAKSTLLFESSVAVWA